MSDSWKLTLPCTKAEAERVEQDQTPFADRDFPPVIMSSEPDETKPDEWRLDAYFETEPTGEDIALFRTLASSALNIEPTVEHLAAEDWVTMSQQGLEPIQAGRFFVHTPVHRDKIPAGAVALEIDAGRAFGTGQHETTTGCLMALDRLKEQGIRPENILDLGTGTGLLAFAALKLWPQAKVAASDIDPVSIDVSQENAEINAIPLGTGKSEVELIVAPGMDHGRLAARAPYDLIIANILAGPLIELAPSVAQALAPGGRLILAGLLNTQAENVATAYRRQGMMGAFDIVRGDWTILTMRKRKALGWQ